MNVRIRGLRVVFVMVAALVGAGCAAMVGYNERQMTIDEIIAMSDAAVGDDVIRRQIDATRSEFDLSPDDIVTLKDAGVADAVIEAMIDSGDNPDYYDYESPDYYWHYYYRPLYGYRGYYYGMPYRVYREPGLIGRFYRYGPVYPHRYDSRDTRDNRGSNRRSDRYGDVPDTGDPGRNDRNGE